MQKESNGQRKVHSNRQELGVWGTLTVSRPRDTVPTNLRTETPDEIMAGSRDSDAGDRIDLFDRGAV